MKATKLFILFLLLPCIALSYISPLTTSFTGSVLFANGTAGAPSVSFTSDTASGMYLVTPGEPAFSVSGAQVMDFQISSPGNFGNVGMGGVASVGDGFPLEVTRDLASGIVAIQVSNTDTAANSTSQFQALTNNANDGVLLGAYAPNSTVAPYVSSAVLRPTANTTHLTLMGGAVTGGNVQVYTGNDFTATGITATFNADHSTSFIGGVTLATSSGTRPTCAVGIRGMMWVVQGGAGVTDTLEICMKAAANTYSWITITTGG